MINDTPLEKGYVCSFCGDFSAGASMNGVEDADGKPVYACWRHFHSVRDLGRRQRLEKDKRRQMKK